MDRVASVVHAWLLNLDAEVELGSPAPYTRRRALVQSLDAHRASCAALCQGEGIVGVHRVEPETPVYCWCPTPSALAELEAAQLHAVRGPSVAVLRSVNHRAWPLTFAHSFAGRCYVESLEAFREVVARSDHAAWRLKRPWGFAGRGQRRLGPNPSSDDERWLVDSLRQGGLLVEPAVDLVREYSIHGYVGSEGAVIGEACAFRTDSFGAPAGIERAHRDRIRDRALGASALLVAERLKRAGYFGPFGVDAFEFERAGAIHLNALGEVNARFTLGWSVGMGSARDAALERYARGR